MARNSSFPQRLKAFARGAIDYGFKSVRHFGRRRFCPVCGRHAGAFQPYGVVARADAQCPWCGSLERHRLLWRFLAERTELFSRPLPGPMLHIAPEPSLESRLRQRLGANYLTADLLSGNVDVTMDICDIRYPADTFGAVLCSHVLEHVPDDRKAMREFFRVLRPDGWAILLVPITVERTIEDPTVTDPAERLRRFGQHDHVRCYGPDYIDRLREAGFAVTQVFPRDFLSPQEVERMSTGPQAGEIYFCEKPTRSTAKS